jgi:hypothetical protein
MDDKSQLVEKKEKLTITEQDLRDLCQQWEIPILILKAAHRSLARGSSDVEIYDVLYVMGQAKMMGLPPMGNWFCLIPATEKQRQKGITGPSVCFKMDAALYLMDSHPRVESGTEEHYWIGGDGQRYEADNPPFFTKAKPTDVIPVIDWDLTCTVSVMLKPGKEGAPGKRVSRTLRYRDWARYPDSSESLWVKMPSHMLWKQTCKELVRMHFGGGIWEDEVREAIDVTPAREALPASTNQMAQQAPQSVQEVKEKPVVETLSPNQTYKFLHCVNSLGVPKNTLAAAMAEFTSRGGSVDEFLAETEKSCSAGPAPEDRNVKVVNFVNGEPSVSEIEPGSAPFKESAGKETQEPDAYSDL